MLQSLKIKSLVLSRYPHSDPLVNVRMASTDIMYSLKIFVLVSLDDAKYIAGNRYLYELFQVLTTTWVCK